MHNSSTKSLEARLAAALAAIGITLAACGGGGGSAPPPPLAISSIADQQVNQGTSVGPVPVVVHAMAADAMTLRIAAAAGNTTLLPQGSVVVGGSGPDRTLTLTPDPDQFGSSPVTVSVTDTNGKNASVTFMLTVNPVYASFTQSTDTAFNTAPDGKPVPVSGVTFVPDADNNADAFATLLR